MSEPSEIRFINGRTVTASEVVTESVTVRDGLIAALDSSRSQGPGVIDLEGDFLLPGLIELHTDNLEKHLVPRPGVLWPSPLAALLAHDAQLAGAGITTVLDGVCVGWFLDEMRPKLFELSIQAITEAGNRDLLRAEHMLHMRCEIADPVMMDMFEPHAGNSLIRLVSFMDHTPGQRQWLNIDKYRLYHRDKKWNETELQARINDLQENQAEYAAANRRHLAEVCGDLHIPMASHDDTLEEHVNEAFSGGAAISEFPTTLEAARRARELGMEVIAGAPNLVRGESHSGNISAAMLGQEKLLTGLSSDYVPISLLAGLFKLHHQYHYTLPEAVALGSGNIARMLGLDDRGEIEPGRRADLIRVRLINDLPVIRGVWCQGLRVA